MVIRSVPTRRSSDLFIAVDRNDDAIGFDDVLVDKCIRQHANDEHGYDDRADNDPLPYAGFLPGPRHLAACQARFIGGWRSEEHTSELQSRENLVCRL